MGVGRNASSISVVRAKNLGQFWSTLEACVIGLWLSVLKMSTVAMELKWEENKCFPRMMSGCYTIPSLMSTVYFHDVLLVKQCFDASSPQRSTFLKIFSCSLHILTLTQKKKNHVLSICLFCNFVFAKLHVILNNFQGMGH